MATLRAAAALLDEADAAAPDPVAEAEEPELPVELPVAEAAAPPEPLLEAVAEAIEEAIVEEEPLVSAADALRSPQVTDRQAVWPVRSFG